MQIWAEYRLLGEAVGCRETDFKKDLKCVSFTSAVFSISTFNQISKSLGRKQFLLPWEKVFIQLKTFAVSLLSPRDASKPCTSSGRNIFSLIFLRKQTLRSD